MIRRLLASLLPVALAGMNLQAQTAQPWNTQAYVYDGAGNIKSIGTDQFRYDGQGRLRSGGAGPGHSQSATYDAYGNIKTLTTDGTMLTFGVNPSTNQLTDATKNVFGTYDSAGRLLSATGGSSFTYTGDDDVTKTTVDGTTEIHLYTVNDERIASITLAGGAETRSDWTLRDTGGKILRRLEKNGSQWTWEQDYVYRAGPLLASEVDSPAGTLHYFPDHLGSTRLITGNGGSQVSFHTYFPFGAEATATNQDDEQLKFTGHERDANSLDYMHARYYMVNWGRFASVDPYLDVERTKLQPQVWNRYTYVANNPVNHTDPSGRCLWDICIGEGAALWAAGTALAATTTVWLNSQSASHPGRTNAEVIGSSIKGALTSAAETVGSLISMSEAPNKTIDDILADTTPGRVTRGPSKLLEKEGGYDDAVRDFEDVIVPGSLEDKGGGVLVGELPDGRTIVVRPNSTDGAPTLEIQEAGRGRTKVRYREEEKKDEPDDPDNKK